ESSLRKWHAYWLVSDCTLEQFTPLQLRLAALYGGDTAVQDLPRVLRVPGFFHRKVKKGKGSGPFLTRLVEGDDHAAFTVAQITVGLPELEAKANGKDSGANRHEAFGEQQSGSKQDGKAEAWRVAMAMAVIPNNKDAWGDWNDTGMAIYRATSGS